MELTHLQSIANQFLVKGSVVTIEPLISGHINSTYVLKTTESTYILQKINTSIFSGVKDLMNNLEVVTNHLKNKDVSTIDIVFTKEKLSFYKDTNNDCWRSFEFIPETYTIEILENQFQAASMGKAFGEFHAALNDLNVEKVVEVLPNFHHVSNRIEDFKKIVQNDVKNRSVLAKDEIGFLLNQTEEINQHYQNSIVNGLPLRVIHQDTKLSNVLFYRNSNKLTVIDLDTVMPGYLCFDFGDAIRSGMSTASEDEKDLSKVDVNLENFQSFVFGYASETKSFISKNEIETLVLGGLLITYEQAIRFLGDYLNGDVYYSIKYESHNLVRAKNQIALLKKLQECYQEMCQLVLKAYA